MRQHARRWSVASLLVAVLVTAMWAADAPKYPEYVLSGTEVRTLPRFANGRDYLLYISLPYSFKAKPEKKYPVVYITDGYWCFARMCGLYGSLVYDKVVPEYITVAIGYPGENLDYGAMRQWELSPAPTPYAADSGHADKFLAALEKEIIPFVEREIGAIPRIA